MKDKKNSIRDLSKRLKDIRRRPVLDREVDEFNRIVSSDEKKQKPESSKKRIARPPEGSL